MTESGVLDTVAQEKLLVGESFKESAPGQLPPESDPRGLLSLGDSCESFRVEGERLHRRLQVGGSVLGASIPLIEAFDEDDLKGAWWRAYLDGISPTAAAGPAGSLRVADLFSGPGGLALGVRQLAAEAGRELVSELCCDTDAAAVAVYAANHGTRRRQTDSAKSLVDYRLVDGDFAYPPEIIDKGIAEAVQGAELVMAGPPCQGHSNLNNHTRRDDKRNELYLSVPAFAIAAEARAVVIENVPAVVHDQGSVVATAQRLLESAGYQVTAGNLAADAMGWPQTRRRFFLVARRDGPPVPLDEVAESLFGTEPRSVWWAIGGGQACTGDPALDTPVELSPQNRERVDWLFDNDEHDLGLAERPDCHQDGTTYGSVYGRMHKDRPAGTITTGFLTPGRGRFVHPTERRTLTPAEAARLQGFPKTYKWTVGAASPTRSQLAKWIGDAVPMPLGYAAALSALAPGLRIG